MPRQRRPLERDTGIVRDATLIVIASEDRFAAKLYFAKFRTSRVQFRVLPAEEGRSSPKAILDRLDVFRSEFSLDQDDQLWYCGDVDHWTSSSHINNLTHVLRRCRQSGYQVALSNPCFELWLLLHFVERPAESVASCRELGRQLSQLCGGYSKELGCRTPLTREMVQSALIRSRQLDQNDSEIPEPGVTRVYRILDELVRRQAIALH